MTADTFASLAATLEDIERASRTMASPDDVRATGTACREAVVTLAQAVYSQEAHLPPGRAAPSQTDSAEMLGQFFEAHLEGASCAEARGLVRSLLTLSHSVVHRRPPSARDARLAVVGLRALVECVMITAGNDAFLANEPWTGVRVGSRYFAWSGPTLHALDDRNPIPAPEEAIHAINAVGHTPFFGLKSKLRRRLAEGALQVFETDQRSWRRELLHSPDGDQVLLVREQPNGRLELDGRGEPNR